MKFVNSDNEVFIHLNVDEIFEVEVRPESEEETAVYDKIKCEFNPTGTCEGCYFLGKSCKIDGDINNSRFLCDHTERLDSLDVIFKKIE